MSLVERAAAFAKHHHSGQLRRVSGEPYVMHPGRVCHTLKAYTDNEIILATALLHDTLEDCPGVTYGLLLQEFGREVADNVQALTNDPEEVQRLGKCKYLCEKIKTLTSEQLWVKLADRLDNVTDSPRPEYLIATKELLESVTVDDSSRLLELKALFVKNPDTFVLSCIDHDYTIDILPQMMARRMPYSHQEGHRSHNTYYWYDQNGYCGPYLLSKLKPYPTLKELSSEQTIDSKTLTLAVCCELFDRGRLEVYLADSRASIV